MVEADASRLRARRIIAEREESQLVGGILADTEEGNAPAMLVLQFKSEDVSVELDGARKVAHAESDVPQLGGNAFDGSVGGHGCYLEGSASIVVL